MTDRRISADELAAILRPLLTGALPIGVPMAIAEWESASRPAERRGFDVAAGPPRRADGSTISSARGLWQIVSGSAAQYGLRPPAYPLGIDASGADDPRDERLDPVRSSAGVVRELERFAGEIDAAGPLDPDLRAWLVYYGHSEGPGALRQVLRGAARPFTRASLLVARPRVNDGPGLEFVGGRWRFWQARYGGGGGTRVPRWLAPVVALVAIVGLFFGWARS